MQALSQLHRWKYDSQYYPIILYIMPYMRHEGIRCFLAPRALMPQHPSFLNINHMNNIFTSVRQNERRKNNPNNTNKIKVTEQRTASFTV
jgi:hypothetical protein